jgi:cardiolipin synthase
VQYIAGNRLTLLTNGEQYFPALVEAIDAATEEVFLETYIFADDQTGSLVADALARAAARSVRVHLLVDGFGARDFAPRFAAMLIGSGARILVFRPIVDPWRLRRGRLRRMHRKLAAIDGRVAFIGGINVTDDYDTPEYTPPRFDYAVRIEGPLAAEVRAAAARLWAQVSWATFKRRWRSLAIFSRKTVAASAQSRAAPEDGQRAALVLRDSLRHRSDIEEAYVSHIASAREEIVIASAYFFPGRRFRHALVQAAARGVRVVLLLQGRVEYLIAHYASQALYGALLDAGVEIHEYRLSFLHAKVAVFDRRTASVGSSNIDPFSLLLAREANVFVDDQGFARELRASLETAMREGARALPPRQWKRQAVWRRAGIWLAYGVARLLMSFAGYERYH